MPWVRIDDHFDEHPKIEAAGPLAGWLFVVGLTYAGRNLTDGFIPARAVPRLANWEGIGVTLHQSELFGIGDDVSATGLASELVALGLWEMAEGGYQIHDYLDYQPSRAQVLAERAQNRQRQAQWRERHSATNKGSHAVSNAGSNGVINGPVTDTPYPFPYPVPEDIKPREITPKDSGVVVDMPAPHGATTTATGKAREAVLLGHLSEDAQAVLAAWRQAFGKRAPPKLNPTQVAKLEEAVVDLGLARLVESVHWCAGKGLAEFPKTLSAAYTKRQRDEGQEYRNGHSNGYQRNGASAVDTVDALAKYDG